MTPPTDAQAEPWLRDAQAGNSAAFAQLVAAHHSRVRSQLRRLTHGDWALADDLAQETFVQAWTALPTFRGQARLSTWLHRIAYTRYLMHRRSSPPPTVDIDPSDPQAPGDEAIAAASSPSGHALRMDVQAALAKLPQAEQLAIIHCYHLELSHDEAAMVLGWPLGTLKSHVARAKAHLRQALAAWQPESTT